MSILTYKQYKLLHENLDSVIGVSAKPVVGLQTEAPQLYNMMSKMAKKMADVPPGLKKQSPMGDDEEMGDHPEPDADDMGGPPDMDADDMDDEDMDDAEGDDLDADADMGDEEDMDDEEEGDEDMGDDMGADLGDMGPMGAGSPPPGPPMKGKGKKPVPPMMKKMSMGGGMSMPKPNMNMKYMKKEAAADPQDAKMKAQNKKNGANDQNYADSGPASKKTTTVREAKCCEKCGHMMSKKCCKMTKEEKEFNDSLMRQTGALKFEKDELGFWIPVKEDVLIQPQIKEQPQVKEEPLPGEVGFAPQGKVGSSFTEWASRHIEAVKNNKK
jgi:hypothetical protein